MRSHLMRTVLGAAAIWVGGFLVLVALFAAAKVPDISAGVGIAAGSLAVVLGVGGALLLRKGSRTGRGLAVGLAFLGGAVGFAFAVGSKNHALGKYCGIEGRNQAYTLTVRIFGTVLHEETGPAVRGGEPGNTVVGPSRELETAMAWWELGLDVALVAAGALVGATGGVLIGSLAGPRGSGGSGRRCTDGE
jgi:hypothetical protein